MNILTVGLFIYRNHVWKRWMYETSPERLMHGNWLHQAQSSLGFFVNILILIVSPIPGIAKFIKIDDFHQLAGHEKVGDVYYLEDFLTAFMLFRFVFLYQQLYNSSLFR